MTSTQAIPPGQSASTAVIDQDAQEGVCEDFLYDYQEQPAPGGRCAAVLASRNPESRMRAVTSSPTATTGWPPKGGQLCALVEGVGRSLAVSDHERDGEGSPRCIGVELADPSDEASARPRPGVSPERRRNRQAR